MFRAIVGALLFVQLGIPLIIWLFSLASEDSSVGCIIFGLAIIIILAIFA